MKTDGFKIGEIKSVRKVDETQNSILIKDEITGVVGIAQGIEIHNTETLWIGERGLEKYEGEFTQTGNDTITNISALLRDDNILNFDFQTNYDPEPYHQEFLKGTDYHWSTIYIDPTNRELEQGVEYDRKLLDVSFARIMDVKEKFVGMETYTVGNHVFDCHVIEFDYGHVNGVIWVAKDELGWFLVYEDAVATEGPFELVLDEYTRM